MTIFSISVYIFTLLWEEFLSLKQTSNPKNYSVLQSKSEQKIKKNKNTKK